MRGKKPSEREKYVLPAGRGVFVEVTREVYLEWHRSRRRERYQMEKKQAHGVCSLEAHGENILSAMPGGYWENTPEENALKRICMEKVRRSISCLPEQDACLVRMLFFDEMTVTDAALACGCSRKSIRKRRDRILVWLRAEMAAQGIVRGCF